MALNTAAYQQVWDTKLAQRLDKPTNWKDTCKVLYTDTQVTNLPYIGTSGEPALATLSASAAGRDLTAVVTFKAITMATDTLSVVTTEFVSEYMDYADQAQSKYVKYADMGALLGKKVDERVEALVMANHGAWTNFGDTGGAVLGLADTAFTVDANNVDDVIKGIIEQIQTANGFDLYKQNGGFIVWRPADWTKLVTFMQANGFTFADEALRDGGRGRIGKETQGLYHYISTQHTANHLMAGVRGVQVLGLMAATFGKTYITETPPSTTAGMLSGTGIHTRIDYGFTVQTNVLPVIFDVRVN